MGVNLKYGTAGATGGGWSSHPGTLQPAYAETHHVPRWNYQSRSPHTWRDPNTWYSRWSFGCRVSGGAPVGSDGAIWYDLSQKDLFEPYSCDGPGCQHSRFILGTTVDSTDAVVANAIVQCFRTTDDVFMAQVTSAANGVYAVPTFDQTGAVQHYLVAYKAGSPDIAGTTVNTLLSTQIDGS